MVGTPPPAESDTQARSPTQGDGIVSALECIGGRGER